ncbi:hypothetical protein CJA_3821 [Cellvibrio japonicus Ueda107]|uniref:Uncharacterized protein n=1 Tax=Cellvibrio japonicus (strain Ueda107) TaxID=498211 RepID=B3PIT9_CELJU|nr:hypothetical protein CJA_3821 [Cellvibrio japonicus Ueda107]
MGVSSAVFVSANNPFLVFSPSSFLKSFSDSFPVNHIGIGVFSSKDSSNKNLYTDLSPIFSTQLHRLSTENIKNQR